jgi:exopolyphosphatase/pppGpp-phosphohydrolase
MPKGREDVILGGAVWLSTLMKTLGILNITASDRDNLEGYAIKHGLMR